MQFLDWKNNSDKTYTETRHWGFPTSWGPIEGPLDTPRTNNVTPETPLGNNESIVALIYCNIL